MESQIATKVKFPVLFSTGLKKIKSQLSRLEGRQKSLKNLLWAPSAFPANINHKLTFFPPIPDQPQRRYNN